MRAGGNRGREKARVKQAMIARAGILIRDQWRAVKSSIG